MLLSSFFAHSMVFAHMPKAQLPFVLFSETFLTIRQNSLNVTVCMIACTFYQGYFIHSLSTLYYYSAPSLATRLTGDYRDRTYTGKCGPASLDTQHKISPSGVLTRKSFSNNHMKFSCCSFISSIISITVQSIRGISNTCRKVSLIPIKVSSFDTF